MAVVHCATLSGQHPALVEFKGAASDSIVVRLDELEDITQLDCLVQADSLPRKTSRSSYSRLLPSSDMPTCIWPISLAARDSKVVVFAVESEEDQRQWYMRLNLLRRYPHSPIPHEPTHNLAKNFPRDKLTPAKFNAGLCANNG